MYARRDPILKLWSDHDIAIGIVRLQTYINHFEPDDFFDARNADKYIHDLHRDRADMCREAIERGLSFITCSSCESDNVEMNLDTYQRGGQIEYRCADCETVFVQVAEYSTACGNGECRREGCPKCELRGTTVHYKLND
jgi:hypothetical protein